jgi:phage gpG-like protein
MIAATLSTAAITAWLSQLGPKAEAAAAIAAAEIADQLLAIAGRNLSGEVLNARTGALRASLAASVDPGQNLRATVTASAPYAAFQEYGFTGTERIRAHLRQQTQAFGRPIAPVTAEVRAHDRRVDYPAHSYLRAALAELSPQIAGLLADATAEALAP